MKLILLIMIATFSFNTISQVERKRIVKDLNIGPKFQFAVKCMKSGESALSSSDSSNFNIAEFNGEFRENVVEYWTEKNNSVTKRTLSSDKIVDITPINDKGCFIIKFKE